MAKVKAINETQPTGVGMQEIARMCSRLVNEKSDMVVKREKYITLFNNSVPVPGHYTKYQEFLQERAQYYAVQALLQERAINRFVEMCGNE